tara:strand:- start:4 stop:186 length:183 start_codon:yes stop_codon:yes gene_type:complete
MFIDYKLNLNKLTQNLKRKTEKKEKVIISFYLGMVVKFFWRNTSQVSGDFFKNLHELYNE